MGEIAEDMVEGLMCSECGVYFQKSNGFPVLCKSCWRQAKKEGRVKPNGHKGITEEGLQETIEKEL